VGWYWRDVAISANPHKGARYLLRFWDVDYLADVWVNGAHVGRHEDRRRSLRLTRRPPSSREPQIALRSRLSPFNEPIDVLFGGKRRTAATRRSTSAESWIRRSFVVAPQFGSTTCSFVATRRPAISESKAAVCNESKSAVRGSIEFTVTLDAAENRPARPTSSRSSSRASAQ